LISLIGPIGPIGAFFTLIDDCTENEVHAAIGVESTGHGGSTFRLTVPVNFIKNSS